ncbi:MAG: class I SAM-dependent methyltransferase [Pseudomonadota bacterium]
MSDFDADWLALRESADHTARNRTVVEAVLKHLNQSDKAVIADLGAGTGSTVRALSDRIDVPQHWHLVDRDEALLSRAAEMCAPILSDTVGLETRTLDLARFPAGLMGIEPNLITTSALLDLVSVDWLSRLVTFALMERIPVYAALTYTGAATLTPEAPSDAAVIHAVNQHQLNDKGFGPALGPAAAERTAKLFRVARFQAVTGESDWELGADQADLQTHLVTGWAEAAGETPLVDTEDANAWLAQRKEWIADGQSRIVVGHQDIAAFPV